MKKIICLMLSVIVIMFSFSACSSNVEITDENVRDTVANATEALKTFDNKKLEKYIDSTTLDYILKLADGHKQFNELGVAIFENLDMTVKSVDLKNSTVTVTVKNKDLYSVASNYAYELTNKYSNMQLLNKLNDDTFLDSSLAELKTNIAAVTDYTDEQDVTLKVSKGKHNLVLNFDEDAENAVSGGALTAIKSVIE